MYEYRIKIGSIAVRGIMFRCEYELKVGGYRASITVVSKSTQIRHIKGQMRKLKCMFGL